jgi:hypothetical protein
MNVGLKVVDAVGPCVDKEVGCDGSPDDWVVSTVSDGTTLDAVGISVGALEVDSASVVGDLPVTTLDGIAGASENGNCMTESVGKLVGVNTEPSRLPSSSNEWWIGLPPSGLTVGKFSYIVGARLGVLLDAPDSLGSYK